jgi:hypothetical protein
MPLVRSNVAREATVMTDEAKHYYDVGDEFAGHGTVKHSEDEYVRHETWIDKANRLHVEPIHTNTVEGYYSIFKRHEGRLPTLRRETSAPLLGGV